MKLEVTQYMIAGAMAVLLIGIALVWYVKRHKKLRLKLFESMEGREFEFFCADLLEKNGFYEVKVTRGSYDYGIDILAEKEGVTYAIQCKRYSKPVGIKAVQEAFAGKEYYDRMVGAVLTNQYFTSSAVNAAKKLKILLWDEDHLTDLMDSG